jgi:type I restriction enzyme, S subunit
MEVKPGYKQTQIGVIPEDWGASLLKDCCSKITDGTHDTPKPVRSGVPFLTAIHVKDNWIDFESCLYLTEADHAVIYSRCNPQKNDVLMVNIGAGVATTALVDVIYEFSLKNVALLKPDARTVGAYLNYSLAQRKPQIIQGLSSGGAQPFLSLTQIGDIEIPLPPTKAEQEAIAEALSDADALIESLEQLLAKKRQLKQGAMQELLTRKKRLPGFSGDWRMKRLGEIAHIKTGGRNNQDKIEEGAYPFFVRSAAVERINSYSHDCEAILIPGEGGIGSIFHYIHGRFDVHQRVYAITQFSPETSGRFVYFYMAQKFGAHAMQNSVKATVDSLRLPTFRNFELVMPPTVEEQAAIAAILSDMDAEIAALEAKLVKARQLKQGMMQELLTGRIRLPVDRGRATE